MVHIQQAETLKDKIGLARVTAKILRLCGVLGDKSSDNGQCRQHQQPEQSTPHGNRRLSENSAANRHGQLIGQDKLIVADSFSERSAMVYGF